MHKMRVHEDGLPVGGGLGLRRLNAAVATTATATVPRREPRWALPRLFAALREPLRSVLPIVLGLLAVAASLVVLVVARAPQLSIVDEAAHADYAYQVSHGHVPAKGAIVDAEIRYEWYCHDLGAAVSSADCAAGFTDDFQADAQDYTFGDPPLYYVVTGYLGRALSPLVPGSHDFITAGRVIGALWLFAGMLVLYLALRAFRVEQRYCCLGAVLLPLCPGVLRLGTAVGVSAVAVVVETQVFATSGRYFAIVTGRYALSFLPWVIACLAVVASRRHLSRSGIAFTGLGLTVMLLATTGLFTLGPALSSRTSFLIG
jgi:hypothetical protein